jgi:hypothetical protein
MSGLCFPEDPPSPCEVWYALQCGKAYKRAGWTNPEAFRDWKRRRKAGESSASIWLTINAQAAIR